MPRYREKLQNMLANLKVFAVELTRSVIRIHFTTVIPDFFYDLKINKILETNPELKVAVFGVLPPPLSRL
jgi:hypothetical protein